MITHLIDFFINFSLASFLKILWKLLFGCGGFLWCLNSKESICIPGDLLLIPGLGRSPGEGNSYPLQYSCLENSMERGAWWAPVHGVARVGEDLATKPPPYFFKLQMSLLLPDPTYIFNCLSLFTYVQHSNYQLSPLFCYTDFTVLWKTPKVFIHGFLNIFFYMLQHSIHIL